MANSRRQAAKELAALSLRNQQLRRRVRDNTRMLKKHVLNSPGRIAFMSLAGGALAGFTGLVSKHRMKRYLMSSAMSFWYSHAAQGHAENAAEAAADEFHAAPAEALD